MNCNEARRHWTLYHDSEGDAELHFQIGEHLAICSSCAQWFAQQSRLESLLVEKLRSGDSTPQMWDRVLRNCGLKQPAAGRRWLWFAGIAAGLVTLVAVLYVFQRNAAAPPDLAKLSADRHQRLAMGQEEPQFRSQSDLEVEDYLRRRVTFPVRCPPRKDAGFAVEGAGVCRLADQPAAYLAGHVAAVPVSIFVLPRESLNTFPAERDAVEKHSTHQCQEGAYQMVMAVIDRNAVLVVGQTDVDSLERVLRAYGTYPDDH